MDKTEIKVDISQVESLGFEFREMAGTGLVRLVERGQQLLRDEVPKVTHNLAQGVTGDVKISKSKLEGRLSVAARTGRREAQTASLVLPGGTTREIRLRPRPAFDYAEAVARGTGIYATGGVIGPKGVIRPKRGKALLVPVQSVKPGESYILSGGQKYVVRRFIRGRRPNPYDVRAAKRLEAEAPAIFDRVVEAFANQQKEF